MMTPSQKSETANGLALLISIQLIFPVDCEITQIEVKKGEINRKAIGYIYGFIDCALQHRQENITNIDVGLPILYHVFRKVFPGHEQTYIDFLMAQMEDEVTVLGMLAGGQEYSEFLREGKPPFGLSTLILGNCPSGPVS